MKAELIEGDAFAWIEMIPDDYFDCILTDPPYGQTSLAWDRWPSGWPAAVRRVLKPTGSMWVFGTLGMFMEHNGDFAGWRRSQDIVWEKQNGSGFMKDRFRRVHEQAVHFYRDDAPWGSVYREVQHTYDAKAKTVRSPADRLAHGGSIPAITYVSEAGGPRLMRSVLQVKNCHGRADHPTQKPEGIIEPLLRYACPPGGRVLDPFAGSGTTGVVAQRLGMQAVLIEGNEKYAAGARRRLEQEMAA